jgi:hypothetical protein
MKQQPPRPRKRQDKLIVRELPEELLVYDLTRDKALCLNQVAAAIWKRCDGKSTPRELARALQLEDRVLWCALDQLGRDGLLEASVEMPPALGGLTRRQHIRELAKAGAIAIPLVTAVTAPSAAEAATCKAHGQSCSSSVQCCSGICSGSKCV